jgi:hypothetical protein
MSLEIPEKVLTVDLGRTCVKELGSHRDSSRQRIRVSGDQSLVYVDIVICDLPRGSDPWIIAGTCGERSRRVGVRHFRVSA